MHISPCGPRTVQRPARHLLLVLAVLAFGLTAATAAAQIPAKGRHYDARAVDFAKVAPLAAPTARQLAALDAKRTDIPELAADLDGSTGATRTLWNRVGYLSGPDRGRDARQVAFGFVEANLDLLGLEAADLSEYEVTDEVYSAVSGATHLYLRQVHQGLPVYHTQLHVNVNREGRILSVNNSFVPDGRERQPADDALRQ